MSSLKIQDVAVIGAGYSGIVAAAHLLRHGLRVTVFERSSVAGGVWRYDPRCGHEPPYPNEHPPDHEEWIISQQEMQNGSSTASLDQGFDVAVLRHAPPGPCYLGLQNNVPTSRMRSALMPWPAGTEEFVPHTVIEKYIQALAAQTGVNYHIAFNTNVISVRKHPQPLSHLYSDKWSVTTRTIIPTPNNGVEFHEAQWDFDAVVVASGHYHLERVPDIPGLAEMKRRFPARILHTKRYKSPESFKGRTVLLVGAGASSLDIAKGLSGVASKIYRSSRGGQFDVPEQLWPGGFERVGEIERLVPGQDCGADSDAPYSLGQIIFKDGTILNDVDTVILGTGYITSYPFLDSSLQSPTVAAKDANNHVIVTSDGCITHNLHKDMFYIPDPSLVFIGVPYHISTFSLYDFQAAVAARVLQGSAVLPTREVMAAEYALRKRESAAEGGSKGFHSLFGREDEYIDEVWRSVIGGVEAPARFHSSKGKVDKDFWTTSRLSAASG